METAWIHKMEFGLAPGEPRFWARVTVRDLDCEAKGHSARGALEALLLAVPPGTVRPDRYILTGTDPCLSELSFR